ncbi:MAG: acyltransferase family protein, partial [Acidimicrobiia bacterium]|nr:acyltransferase family protein [Acidimicrobiia bacterium]
MTTILTRARAAAAATPSDRLRSIDFIRAASMLVVVLGHWLMALIWLDGDTPRFGHALADAPWTQWLTWAVQVMPLFFLAGGFSNARSLDAARRSGKSSWEWVGARVRRLMTPTVPLVVAWTALLWFAGSLDPQLARAAATVALVPLWFLAVYVVVVLLAPLTHRLHARFGPSAITAGAALAVGVDVLRFGLGWEWIGWANFAFVWLTIHQVGYAWD